MILHEIQNHHGYVPRDISIELAKELGIPLARIYEVITFYNFFRLNPPAKHHISVCLGTACYLKLPKYWRKSRTCFMSRKANQRQTVYFIWM